MDIWHVGNTTVRTPYRLRDALRVIKTSLLEGRLSGRDQEYAFAKALHDNEVLFSKKIENGERDSSVESLGRKWRVALSQLGFLTPNFSKKDLEKLELNNYKAFAITEQGEAFAASETIQGQQECLLRSLMAYTVPSLVETKYKFSQFSPLRFVLLLMKKLEESELEPYLSFEEFSLYVQVFSPDKDLDELITSISTFRDDCASQKGSLRTFKSNTFKARAKQLWSEELTPEQLSTKVQTLRDYTDLTLRYFKATGLFKAKGRGIVCNVLKQSLIDLVVQHELGAITEKEYFLNLWKGAVLPTDDVYQAGVVVKDLVTKLKARGDNSIPEGIDFKSITSLTDARFQMEETLAQYDELDYYQEQREQIDEILAWIGALRSGRSVSHQDTVISIPRSERPAYFEWIVWRAFLAINSLANRPWEARRFKVDQDFLPVSHAPGNGADMIFEFEDYVIPIEVTLTGGSRQEAAEGEPVRRHVASCHLDEKYAGKDIYGLFIAPTVDLNTINTFRYGDWFTPNENYLELNITPVTLEQFEKILRAGKDDLDFLQEALVELFITCREQNDVSAPDWRDRIALAVEGCC